MTVINTNIKSLISQNALSKNSRSLSAAMEQLSTGKRINSAKDDAAGLAITSRMTSQIKGLDQSIRNGNDAISMLQTAEGAMIEITGMAQRMRELSVQAANDTYSTSDRSYLNLEYQQLKQEINRITQETQWNGFNLLDGSFLGDQGTSGKFAFQVGASKGQVITHTLGQVGFTVIPQATVTAPAGGSTTMTVAGNYKAGDTIKLTIDGTAVNYTVVAADVAAAKPNVAIATKIAAAATSTLSTYTVTDNLDGTVKIGPGTASVAKASIESSTWTSITPPSASGASTLSVKGTYAVGDSISVTINGNVVSYTVTDSDTKAATPNNTIAANIADMAQTVLGTAFKFSSSTNTVAITSGDKTATSTAVTSTTGTLSNIVNLDISSTPNSNESIRQLDSGLDKINQARAGIGAMINRLTYAVDNLTNVSQYTSASRSTILDADYAKASSELARTQIIQQAATAVLAQANTDQQTVLKLLQG